MVYMRTHAAAAVAYIAAGVFMAIFYSVVVNELIQVTSSLSTTVLGTGKHVVMTIFSAIVVDHIFDRADSQAAIVWVGMILYLPSMLAYAYLNLTHQALEPWSYRPSERQAFCFACPCPGARRKGAPPSESSALLEPGAAKA